MTGSRFANYAWIVLLYNLPVILWGAFVRATGSGAGCGNHWPLCDGAVIPRAHSAELLIEFAHRLSTGVAGLLVLGLLAGAFRAYPKGHETRRYAVLSFLFTGIEALIGALLVKFEWVASDASLGRAIVMPAHLANTLLLLGALTMTACTASSPAPVRLRGQGAVGWAVGFALFGVIAIGVSGGIAALGDTLFPARSLAEGIRQDLSPGAHFLLRLRLVHPWLAVSVGLYLIFLTGLLRQWRPAPAVIRYGQWVGALFLAQIFLGLVNVALLAPVWMQLAHLLLADLTWIALVLLSAAALTEGVERREMLDARRSATGASEHAGAGRATWKDYLVLTKPRVISLLLFTTLTAMVIAAKAWPGTGLFLAVALGGYMAAGAANAINMVIDRDIDGRMKRTAKRPTVTQAIPSRHALLFSFALEIGSFALLWGAANLLSAFLALAGLLFYVIVYTLVLKRRTWHNIVIGGAAGAFPPLVGWAAVTNELSPLAWYLFAIIFAWTPVHFWALALMIKDDYASVGVPMLPVVRGERVTVTQIALYTVLTVIVSALPLLQREVHLLYFGAAALLNLGLALRAAQLYRLPDRPRALSLYKYSMAYLALLFLVMAIDRVI